MEKEPIDVLVENLNGREYGNECNDDDRQYARKHKLVIVYGSSDDLMEFDGSIIDELGAYEGTCAYLDKKGLLEASCRADDCPHEEKMKESCKTITAVWCGKNKPAWSFETDIPHKIFTIMEDGEPECEGIVFKLEELAK